MRLAFFCDFFLLALGLLVLGLAAFVVVFGVMLGCPFVGSRPQDAGAGVVRWEIVRFVVNQLAPADFRSVAYLGPPCRAFGV